MSTIELTDEQYDALRALQVETEDSDRPARATDVAMNIRMLTGAGQDPAVWEQHLRALAALALAQADDAGGYRVTDAGHQHVDDRFEAKVAAMRARVDAGLAPFDDED